MRSGSSCSEPERGALRADVAAAPGVVAIAPDAGDAPALDLNLQAAHGFTQWTGVEVPAVFADTGQRFGEPGRHRCLPNIGVPKLVVTHCNDKSTEGKRES